MSTTSSVDKRLGTMVVLNSWSVLLFFINSMLSLILSTIDRNADCKIVWGEGDKEKIGRGRITADDENFVFLVGERGKVIVNKHNIIAIKQM